MGLLRWQKRDLGDGVFGERQERYQAAHRHFSLGVQGYGT